MTVIKLLNVPFESNYKDTVYFGSKQEQTAYMNSKVVRTISDVTYQRRDNIIRVPAHIDSLYNCNYVAYTNEPHTSKVFYAFIVSMEYVNDGRTDIKIQTDVLQTWMFDYSVKTSFVEREHVNDDTIGLHTIPEGLETGEFEADFSKEIAGIGDLCVVWGATKTQTGANVTGANYAGIYSGVKYYYASLFEPLYISDVLKAYDEAGHGDAIQCMFIAPLSMALQGKTIPDNIEDFPYHGDIDNSQAVWERDITSSNVGERSLSFGNGIYTPKNKKLLTFPYKHLTITNNNGGEAIYKYERFRNNTPAFKMEGVITPGCSIRLVPKLYNGVAENDLEGLNLGKFPICNWNSDAYTNWLTQNSVNIGLSVASGVGQVIGGVAMAVGTGGLGMAVGGGSIVGGVSTIANTLAQVHQQSFTPPQSKGNINCGDVITSAKKNNFVAYHMSIKVEYARIIDEYFSMFGYKVSRVKVPNKNHRSHYWFTKTVDVNIDGAIPNTDLQTIKDCYNRGITFWRASSEMGNYNVANSIIE